ncbi:MAG: hypothetical protein HKL80_02090 [Acidimicrobiales bacterium]|nr:hypothetical protein [Acidimicrobiales bacterium]
MASEYEITWIVGKCSITEFEVRFLLDRCYFEVPIFQLGDFASQLIANHAIILIASELKLTSDTWH